MNALGPSHLAILAVAVIILFGAKRLPDAARSLGKSMRIFKSEVRELQNEAKPDSTANSTTVSSERVDPPAAGGPSV